MPAKGHAGKNGKSDGANDRGKSPRGNKENPCWYHFKAEKGFSQQEDGAQAGEHAQRKGEGKIEIQIVLTKEGGWGVLRIPECENSSACKYKHELIKKNNSAPATSGDKTQPKSKAAPKAAAPAIVRRAIAMPVIVLKQSVPATRSASRKTLIMLNRMKPRLSTTSVVTMS